MNQNSGTYTYGYPNTWGSANSALTYYPYANPSPVQSNYLPPATQAKTQNTYKKDNSSRLRIALIIVAVLLLAAILALITLGVLYQKCESKSADANTTTVTTTTTTTTTTVPPTVIGFRVTRIDLNYSSEMAQTNSSAFAITNVVFCDMITKSWLEGQYASIKCQCVKFGAGSIVATVHLIFDHTMGTAADLLKSMQTTIPTKSKADGSTNKVEAADIALV